MNREVVAGHAFVIFFAVAFTALFAGCGWMQSHPNVGPDAAADALCILEHAEMPPLQIAAACSIQELKTITDILSAKDRAMGRDCVDPEKAKLVERVEVLERELARMKAAIVGSQ